MPIIECLLFQMKIISCLQLHHVIKQSMMGLANIPREGNKKYSYADLVQKLQGGNHLR
jgi:hypothetical protein